MRFNVKLRTVPVEIRASRGKAQWSAMFVPRLYGQGLESQWQTVEHTYVVITRVVAVVLGDTSFDIRITICYSCFLLILFLYFYQSICQPMHQTIYRYLGTSATTQVCIKLSINICIKQSIDNQVHLPQCRYVSNYLSIYASNYLQIILLTILSVYQTREPESVLFIE